MAFQIRLVSWRLCFWDFGALSRFGITFTLDASTTFMILRLFCYIYIYIYMELDIQKWCYFSLCEPILWQNVRMKDLFEGGFVEGCAVKRKLLFVVGATKHGIESQLLFWERTLYLYERIIWEYWSLGIVRVSLYHIMYSSYLLVKICFAIAYGCRLKVESCKFLEFFLVGDNVYFLVEFSSFLSYVWWGLLKVYNIFIIDFAWDCYLEAFSITIW